MASAMALMSAALAGAAITPPASDATAPAATMVSSAAPAIGTRAASPIKLEIGTQVPLILDETLSSQKDVKGDLVHLTVAKDVLLDGRVIFFQGTKAIGELTVAERKGALGAAGRLQMRLLYLECDHQIVRLSGVISARGEDGTTAAVLTAVAVGGIALVVTGKSAIIQAGTALIARLDHDAWVTRP